MASKRFLTLALAAVFAISASAPAVAQETPDEYADEWTEARRGDRDWTQRATEELTTGLTERVMGRPPTGPTKEAAQHIYTRIADLWRRTRDPCLAAALNLADSQAAATDRQATMSGAFDMLTSALGGAASGNDIRKFLGQRLFNQIKDKLQEQALDRFKEEMREAMKRGLPDYWSNSNNSSSCNVEYRGVWDRATESYEFIIAGDCACGLVPCGPHIGGHARLRRWTVEGSGTIVPVIEQGAQGEKTIRYAVGQPELSVTAECCGQNDQRRHVTSPATGSGNEWVGFVRQPQTTPQTPPRPQTGGTPPATGTTGTTPQQGTTPAPAPVGPPRRRIDIPEVPDAPMTRAELEALGERIHAAQESAQDAHRAAEAYRNSLDDRPASEAEIRDADAAVEEARRAALRARAALDKVMEKFNQLDQQQSSLPSDPTSARLLAVHNAERAAVGMPPLLWDRALQASATAFAGELARTGRLAHAPRAGRGIERENLSQGMLGWSPDQMMRNWVVEKRNFVAGTYPNVSRTGRWQDVSHYTQMIWPTTRRIGCGMARGSGYQWLVCRYTPGGNREGHPVGTRDML